MIVRPVKENTKDYTAATAVGALGGYTVKNIMPLSDYERTEFFTPDIMRTIKGIERDARETEYDSIVIGAKEGTEEIATNVLDIFKKNRENIIGDKFDDLLESIKNNDNKTQESVVRLSKRVRDCGREARKTKTKTVEALAKGSRPTSYFILLGSVICLSFAVLRNALKKSMVPSNDYKSIDRLA